MSDKQTEPNQRSPDVPEWFLDERPVLLGELYFLEDERCEVERAGRDAEVDLVVRLKENASETSVGVIVRGDVMTEGDDTAEFSQSRSFSLSSLQLPDPASLDDQPVIVLFFDMTTDEGYGQVFLLNDFMQIEKEQGEIDFTNLEEVQPSVLIETAARFSPRIEPENVDLPSMRVLRATTLNRVGTLHLSEGRHEDALKAFNKAFSLVKTSASAPSRLVALTLSNLAQAHHASGRPEEAEAFYNRALTVMDDAEAPPPARRPSSSAYSTLLGL